MGRGEAAGRRVGAGGSWLRSSSADSCLRARKMGHCCASLAKYLLCLANFVFFVVGGLVLTVGVWVAADKASFVQMTQLDAVLNSEVGSKAQNLLAEYSQPGVLEQAGYLLIAAGFSHLCYRIPRLLWGSAGESDIADGVRPFHHPHVWTSNCC